MVALPLQVSEASPHWILVTIRGVVLWSGQLDEDEYSLTKYSYRG